MEETKVRAKNADFQIGRTERQEKWKVEKKDRKVKGRKERQKRERQKRKKDDGDRKRWRKQN